MDVIVGHLCVAFEASVDRLDSNGLLFPISEPFWAGLRNNRLLIQRYSACRTWQFGPEWLCHACHRFDPDWVEVEPKGRIFSWERVWHAAHSALSNHLPYLVVLVELPQAGGVRLVGNLLGDVPSEVKIGGAVEGCFEHHLEAKRSEAEAQPSELGGRFSKTTSRWSSVVRWYCQSAASSWDQRGPYD